MQKGKNGHSSNNSGGKRILTPISSHTKFNYRSTQDLNTKGKDNEAFRRDYRAKSS